MYYHKNTKIATELINITNEGISVYEGSSGNIVKLNPKKLKLPERPNNKSVTSETFYILKEETANELAKNGRSLDDVAIIRGTGIGRNQTKITYFAWGGNVHEEVCLYCK